MLTVNGKTYPDPKLTDAQANAMWFYACGGVGGRGKLSKNGSVNAKSVAVLRGAGLLAERMTYTTADQPATSVTKLTDFGRAWIADQIDQARDEAGNDPRQATDESNQRMRYYRLHHDCTHGYGMAEHIDCDHDQANAEEARDRADEAEYAQYRAWVDSHGGPTGRFHQQREMRDVDHAEALEMDRRLDEADIIAARMGFDAHTEALAEAAERQMAAWRFGHGMAGKPSRSDESELRLRDHREALATDSQRERDLNAAADAEQIGAWRARHVGRSPVDAFAADWTEALAMESERRGGCGRVILATRVAGPDMCTTETPCAQCARAAAVRLTAQIRREMVEALERAGFSTLPTYGEDAIQPALDDGVIEVIDRSEPSGRPVYALIDKATAGPCCESTTIGAVTTHENDCAYAASLRAGQPPAGLPRCLWLGGCSNAQNLGRDEGLCDDHFPAGTFGPLATTNRAAILDALADGPHVLSNHPHDAVQAALRDGVIRAWGPSATGRTVYALAPVEPPSIAELAHAKALRSAAARGFGPKVAS